VRTVIPLQKGKAERKLRGCDSCKDESEHYAKESAAADGGDGFLSSFGDKATLRRLGHSARERSLRHFRRGFFDYGQNVPRYCEGNLKPPTTCKDWRT
jgi:hypothetical protein